MATMVSISTGSTAAERHGIATGAGGFDAKPTIPQDAMMTTAISNLDKIKSPTHAFLHSDGIYEVARGTPPRNDIKKGIPSVPALWMKRGSTQKGSRKPKGKRKSISVVQSKAPPCDCEANGAVAALSPQQPSQLGAQGLDVQLPLPMRERLKSWNLSSSLHLIADENAEFQSADFERLKQFIHFLDENCPALFHGRLARNLCFTLVAISPSSTLGSSTSSPYICVKGLMKESEITSVHTVLSQRSVRAHYKPLRLCYDKSLVETAASGATYQTNTSEVPETLCGTLLRTEQRGKGVWMSTIGGIIEIDGKFFVMTTSHHPSTADTTSDESVEGSMSETEDSSVADTLVEKNSLDADIEPALIIDTWKEQERPDDVVDSATTEPLQFTEPPRPTNPFFWPDFAPETVAEGSDWRILVVEEKLQLPNSIPFQQRSEGNSQQQQTSARAQTHRRYLEAYPTEPSRRPVCIMAGISGLCSGLLSSNVSFLTLRGERSRAVWSVKLDPGFELQKGDSGSWVIDTACNNIIGCVIAISDGSVYLIPLRELFAQINNALKPNEPIRIPSPFRMLASLARNHFATDPEGNKELSEHYASEALSPEVLNMRTFDQAMQLLRTALQTQEDKGLLMRLLCYTGADLCSVLGSLEAWSAEHNIELDLYRLLVRLHSLYTIRGNSEIGAIGVDPAEPQDIEKGKRLAETSDPSYPSDPLEPPLMRLRYGLLRIFLPSRNQAIRNLKALHHLKYLAYGFLGIGLYTTYLGYGVAASVAATAVFTHMEGLPHNSKIFGNGAIVGLVFSSIFHVQMALLLLPALLKRSKIIETQRRLSRKVLFGLIMSLLQFGLSFARSLLTALTLISRFKLQNKSPIFIGASIAAGPLALDALSIGPKWYGLGLLIPGYNALAGFTFAIVCNEYGYFIADYRSAAAAGAVYGAVNMFLAIWFSHLVVDEV